MTIEYMGEEFDRHERYISNKPFIGYFAPNGELVDYNTALGGSHSDLGNVVSWTFLLWIKQSKAFKEFGLDISTKAKLNEETGRITGAYISNDSWNKTSNIALLEKDLLTFLHNIESNEKVIGDIKSKININKIPEYVRKEKKIPTSVGYKGAESILEIESLFGCYNTKELLLLLKDLCVQYLGYDSIEQFKPNGEPIILPKNYIYYPENYLNHFEKPRIITTSSNHINERFFKYLVMDWAVHQIPRYRYNERTKLYEPEPEFKQYLTQDKEDIYAKEIQSIKRLVPLKDRLKYIK